MAEEVEWFAGIDWASQSHQVFLVDAHGECLGERAVAHGGLPIEELCDWLIARTGAKAEAIAVAIEMTQGPVVEALLERGFCVYGINPKQLDRFRDRFTVAGATDDRRDAHVLADSLRTDRHAFRRLLNDEPVIVQLREWSRMADELQQERTRLANRMREQLWRYYPQMLERAATDYGDEPDMAAGLAALTRLTRPLNYLGLPGVVVPAGFVSVPFIGSPNYKQMHSRSRWQDDRQAASDVGAPAVGSRHGVIARVRPNGWVAPPGLAPRVAAG